MEGVVISCEVIRDEWMNIIVRVQLLMIIMLHTLSLNTDHVIKLQCLTTELQ